MIKIGRFTFFALIISLYASPSFSEFTVKTYKAYKNDNDMRFYIMGLGKGFIYADAYTTMKYGEGVFCPPSNLVLESENFFRILDDEIKRTEAIDFKEIQSANIEMLLGSGLKNTFPCAKTKKK